MTPTLIPLLVSKFYCRKLVAAVHVAAGHYSDNGLKRIRWIARWWTDSFVCVSNTVARGIFGFSREIQYYGGRVQVIPNTINLDSVRSATAIDWRLKFGLPTDSIVIGYVGRLSENKGVKGFDIAVVPSREEGFGITALEAMACGVALIASRVDALEEVVLDRKTGILFAVGDATDLSRKIFYVIENKPIAIALGRAALEHSKIYSDRVLGSRLSQFL